MYPPTSVGSDCCVQRFVAETHLAAGRGLYGRTPNGPPRTPIRGCGRSRVGTLRRLRGPPPTRGRAPRRRPQDPPRPRRRRRRRSPCPRRRCPRAPGTPSRPRRRRRPCPSPPARPNARSTLLDSKVTLHSQQRSEESMRIPRGRGVGPPRRRHRPPGTPSRRRRGPPHAPRRPPWCGMPWGPPSPSPPLAGEGGGDGEVGRERPRNPSPRPAWVSPDGHRSKRRAPTPPRRRRVPPPPSPGVTRTWDPRPILTKSFARGRPGPEPNANGTRGRPGLRSQRSSLRGRPGLEPDANGTRG